MSAGNKPLSINQVQVDASVAFLVSVHPSNSNKACVMNEACVLWISDVIRSHLKQISVHCFSIERSVYINVSEGVVDGSDLKYIPHVSCNQREVYLREENKKA